MSDSTTLAIKKTTRDRLRELGTKGETWDELINRLIDERKEIEKQ